MDSAPEVVNQLLKAKMDSVLRSIDTIDSDERNWNKHQEVCSIIFELFNEKSVDSLGQHFADSVLEYLGVLVCLCEDADTLDLTIKAIIEFPLNKLESFLLKLIPTTNQMSSQEDRLDKLKNLCKIMQNVLSEHRDSLNQTVLDRMYAFCLKLILKYKNGKLIDGAIDAIAQFPMSALESLLAQLIGSMEDDLKSEHGTTEWFRHEYVTWIIQDALKAHRGSLNDQLTDRMFDYMVKIIQNCEHEKFNIASETIPLFSLAKLDASLPQLLDVDFVTDRDKCYKHRNMTQMIFFVWTDHGYLLDEMVLDGMFDYLSKVLHHCEDVKLAIEILLRNRKSKFESLLTKLIDSKEDDLISKECTRLCTHENIVSVIRKVLKTVGDSLNAQITDRFFEYLAKIIQNSEKQDLTPVPETMGYFSHIKLEALLPPLIDSIALDLDAGRSEWNRHKIMSEVIQCVLIKHKDMLDEKLLDRIFEYLSKQILKCENKEQVVYAFFAFTLFPLPKLESLLTKLIDSIEEDLNSDECTEWHKHRNVNWVIVNVLKTHGNSLNEHFSVRLFDYLAKIIHNSENKEDLKLPTETFFLFPLRTLEVSLPPLIDSMELDLQTDHRKWYRHQNMCGLLQYVLGKHRDSLDEKVIDRLFDYLSKLMHHCDKPEAISYAFGVFQEFTFVQFRSYLSRMVDSMESELKNDSLVKSWHKHQNMSLVIDDFIIRPEVQDEEVLVFRIYDYMSEFVRQCADKSFTSYAEGIVNVFKPVASLYRMRQRVDALEGDMEANPDTFDYTNANLEVWSFVGNLFNPPQISDSMDEETIKKTILDVLTRVCMYPDLSPLMVSIKSIAKLHLNKVELFVRGLIEVGSKQLNTADEETEYVLKNISIAIHEVLKAQQQHDSLSQSTIADGVLEYGTKLIHQCKDEKLFHKTIVIFGDVPLSKLEPFLCQLMDTMEADVDPDRCKTWFKHQNMAKVIQFVLDEHRDSLDEKTIDRMFCYFTKLIYNCGSTKAISNAFVAFGKFPLSKLQATLPKMISSLECEFIHKNLKIESNQQQTEINWFRHQNISAVILEVLHVHRASFNQSLIDQMFDYCVKLIQYCENQQMIGFAVSAFEHFPSIKVQTLLSQLREELKSDQATEWFKHENMCSVLENVLTAHSDALSQTFFDQIFDYCTKLLILGSKDNRVTQALNAFKKIPRQKLEISLSQLIKSAQLFNTRSEQNIDWAKYQNVSFIIGEVVKVHPRTLSLTLVDQMFEYLTKLILKCKDGDLISNSFMALSEFPLNIICSTLTKLIKSLKNELENETSFSKLIRPMMCEVKVEQSSSIQWHSHNNACRLIQQVLKVNQNSTRFGALFELMFDYLSKLIRKCKDENQISCLFTTFNHFSMGILKRALPKLIKSMKIETEQSKWYRNENMSRVVVEVLKEHRDSLDRDVIDRMFEYCTKLVQKRQVQSAVEALAIIKQKREIK